MSAEDAIQRTTEAHGRRLQMSERWRRLGSPQTARQKRFVFKFFQPIYFYKSFRNSFVNGFSNSSHHPVSIPDIGLFATSEAAFLAHKNLSDDLYINRLKQSRNSAAAKRIGRQCLDSVDWQEMKVEYMERVVRLKVEQNESVRINLLQSALRPICDSNRHDSFWGTGENGRGLNILGKILMSIRAEMLLDSGIS
jgi:ribA/ribD-fused uncharacterized protein